MWFGTSEGVSRFDGLEFTHYGMSLGLSDNEVFFILEDLHHRIWFLTYSGRYSYYRDGIIYNATNDSLVARLNTSVSANSHLLDSKGNLWIGTKGGEIILLSVNDQIRKWQLKPAGKKEIPIVYFIIPILI